MTQNRDMRAWQLCLYFLFMQSLQCNLHHDGVRWTKELQEHSRPPLTTESRTISYEVQDIWSFSFTVFHIWTPWSVDIQNQESGRLVFTTSIVNPEHSTCQNFIGDEILEIDDLMFAAQLN